MTPADILQMCKDEEVVAIDFKFCDFLGTLQHFTIPVDQLSEETFEDGLGFDGSSIRGWQEIQESDMVAMPDPASATLEPFYAHKTLSLICNILDPITKAKYSRDPRNVALKAEAYLKSTGIADTAYFGPELEFFLFSNARFKTAGHESFYHLDAEEGPWNTGKKEPGGNLAYRPRHKEGYFPAPPTDSIHDVRQEMVELMKRSGIVVECQHHEVATSQCEIDMRFNTLARMADQTMWYKHVVRNVAREHGLAATFMPKPLFGDNGSGMHTHQSLWKGGKPLFPGNGFAGLSEMAIHYIGGLLKHAPSIIAFSNPTTNSYKRLVPGYEAPINLVYSQRNRSAAIRIPMHNSSPKAKRVEFRTPDPSCNPYYAFSAMLLAGLDGVINKIDPGPGLDKNIYDLPAAEAKNLKRAPGSLDEALDALERDHDFLLKGDVFTEDVIAKWISWKRDNEIQSVRSRPHPREFELYFDC
jgi:glutamine synthetase